MKKVNWYYWNQFLESVADAVTQLGSPPIVWFRGVQLEHHLLVPSLLRLQNGALKETELYERYYQISRGISQPNDSRADWDILFEMQHYGVPTRLIDWTEVFGIAVFFACLVSSNSDRFVYVLNPTSLNNKVGKSDLIGEWDRRTFGYQKVFWEGVPIKPGTPVAINPSHSNARLAAQRGRFTVHGVDINPLEKTAPDCVRKIRLPAGALEGAYEFLSIAGINEFSIFPDVAGAAPFLKNIVGLQ